jgi:methyltransferase
MTGGVLLLGVLTLQRLAELVLARSNTRRLVQHGAVEHGRSHYPLIVAFHAAWLAGLWVLGWSQPIWVPGLVAVLLLQAGRFWVLGTLGRRWTTRIIVVPGEELVARGPFRWVRHPNYCIVAGEIAAVPLALGLPLYAVLASVVHAGVLWIRIRAEDRALNSGSIVTL